MIAIAGAGIGGLTLGCALAHHGIPFRILEKAPELKPAGAGIALAENALRALSHAGLDEAARNAGALLRRADLCDPSGRVIGGIADLPYPAVVMTRTALQRVLLEPVRAQVERGRAVSGYDDSTDHVRVRLAAGDTLDAAALVGADGLHSNVRRRMRGDEPLRYSGQTSWRAIANIELPDRAGMSETWGPGLRFGIVPLRDGQVYWFAVATAPAGGRDPDDVVSMLRTRFNGWHEPIDRVLAATPPDAVLRTDIHDRPPIRRWVDGRVALLGDAAHPMTPNLGMGGCQAIEDAIVLADALAREPSIARALARYEARRVHRANQFVEYSRTVGRVAHVRSAPLRWLRDRALAATPHAFVRRQAERAADFKL